MASIVLFHRNNNEDVLREIGNVIVSPDAFVGTKQSSFSISLGIASVASLLRYDIFLSGTSPKCSEYISV